MKKNNGPLTYEQSKDKALRLLAFRAHSEYELRDKLKRANAVEEDIDRIIEFCKEYKFLNDADFAKRKAADLKNLKKFGKNRIKSELRRVGISSDIIEDVLVDMDFEDEADKLLPLVEKKLDGDFERKSKDRCIRYFMYRGYDFYTIKNCIDTVVSENEE